MLVLEPEPCLQAVSGPDPTIRAVPRAKPVTVFRSTSATLPSKTTVPPRTAATAATGSSLAARASARASPSSTQRERLPRTYDSLTCAPDIAYCAVIAEQPISTVAVRASRSAQRLSTVSKTAVLPFSSASAIGVALIPDRVGRTIWTSGKARPIASASITGRPSSAAATIGLVELTPPTSMQAMCVGATPRCVARLRIASANWPAEGSFSTITVGAPIIATLSTTASSGRSSTATTGTGPCSRTAASASRRPM